jgi:hypothetical protein
VRERERGGASTRIEGFLIYSRRGLWQTRCRSRRPADRSTGSITADCPIRDNLEMARLWLLEFPKIGEPPEARSFRLPLLSKIPASEPPIGGFTDGALTILMHVRTAMTIVAETCLKAAT